jgi:hypothetical protein
VYATNNKIISSLASNQFNMKLAGNKGIKCCRRLWYVWKQMADHNCLNRWGQDKQNVTTHIQMPKFRERGEHLCSHLKVHIFRAYFLCHITLLFSNSRFILYWHLQQKACPHDITPLDRNTMPPWVEDMTGTTSGSSLPSITQDWMYRQLGTGTCTSLKMHHFYHQARQTTFLTSLF